MRKKILLVDDQQLVTRALRRVMEGLGYIVAEENDSSHVIESALEFLPDLIVLDIAMPDMDGADIVGLIRHHAQLRDVPTVFFSGMLSAEEAHLYTRNLNARVVSKSDDLGELLSTVDCLLEDGR